MNDDEEQPGTRARISNLIEGLHGVYAAEDDEFEMVMGFQMNGCLHGILKHR